MFGGLKKARFKTLPNDIISGIIIALVSIPISMGYAQIAGLPPIYGLYGSILPVIIFALFSSSPQFIFGVDAAPAALVGGVLATLGISAGSEDAQKAVPLLAFYTGIWLFLFYIFKAGRLTEYVSTPVMGGFISGICTTIILMQIPKLFGGVSGTGEIHELAVHIIKQAKLNFSLPSLILGLTTLALILICKKFAPKFPMPVLIMIAAGVLQYFFNYCTPFEISTLPKVTNSLDNFSLLDFSAVSPIKGMGLSLTIAVVIMAETLLSENNFAIRNDYKINDNNEVLTFALCNISASAVGCCPVNGSVSRSSMNNQFGGKSQVTSITAAVIMLVIVTFCTGFIQYLPVPVLTAIVISALLGAIEFDLAKKLRKINKKEFFIFLAAFFGVLIFGTIYGVIIGVILSFVNVVIRESNPPRSFLGVVPNRGGFFDLNTNENARPIKNVVIYRFRANLFFANVKEFREDIENSVKPDTKCVIVDASSIGSIDTTGAATLEGIYTKLKQNGIRFYLTEHSHALNDELRQLDLGHIIEEGGVRRTISAALRAQGIQKPYELELGENDSETTVAPNFKEQLLHEFEWAFGDSAEERIETYTEDILKNARNANLDEKSLLELTDLWSGLGSFDEDILLESLELHLSELSKSTGIDEDKLAKQIEERRETLYQYVKEEDEEAFKNFRDRRHEHMHLLRDRQPELYRKLHDYHEEIVEKRKEHLDELAEKHKERQRKDNQ